MRIISHPDGPCGKQAVTSRPPGIRTYVVSGLNSSNKRIHIPRVNMLW